MSQTKRKNKNQQKKKKGTSAGSPNGGAGGVPILGSVKGKSNKLGIYGRGDFFKESGMMPAAYANVDSNSTFCKQVGTAKHKSGFQGIVLVGCQPLTTITTTNANSNIFTATSLATLTDGNTIRLSPDILNGPLAAQANYHGRYLFTDIMIEYVSNVPTSQANSCCLAIETDQETVSASFAENREVIPSVTFPYRTDRAFLTHHFDLDELYYVKLNGGTQADVRQTVQALIVGWPDITSTGNLTMGYTNIWYRIELYQPVPTQGFTLMVKNRKEQLMFQELYKRYSESKSVDIVKKLTEDDEDTKAAKEELGFFAKWFSNSSSSKSSSSSSSK